MKFKILVPALVLLSSFGGAFSPNSQKIQMGKSSVIALHRKGLMSHVVSLELDVKSKMSQLPKVSGVNLQKGLCQHKQTLISYAGFDQKEKKYLRTYEIQIEVNKSAKNTACTFVITSEKKMKAQDGARVTILL